MCSEKIVGLKCVGKVLERVTRITKSGGDVEPHVILVEQPCCINWVNGCETGLQGL